MHAELCVRMSAYAHIGWIIPSLPLSWNCAQNRRMALCISKLSQILRNYSLPYLICWGNWTLPSHSAVYVALHDKYKWITIQHPTDYSTRHGAFLEFIERDYWEYVETPFQRIWPFTEVMMTFLLLLIKIIAGSAGSFQRVRKSQSIINFHEMRPFFPFLPKNLNVICKLKTVKYYFLISAGSSWT